MVKRLEVYCVFCGVDQTDKSVSEIVDHLEKVHKVSLFEALSGIIIDIFERVCEVDE